MLMAPAAQHACWKNWPIGLTCYHLGWTSARVCLCTNNTILSTFWSESKRVAKILSKNCAIGRTNIHKSINRWVKCISYGFNTNRLKENNSKIRNGWKATSSWLENASTFYSFSVEIHGRLTLTYASASSVSSLMPAPPANNILHAAAFQPSRHHAPVIWSLEINGFYFHGIAMVMNHVINHRIARVTVRVINQDFSLLFFFCNATAACLRKRAPRVGD